MTPHLPNRAQTEPLAALVAVSAFIVGVGLYGAYVTDTLPGTSDRTQEKTAIDRVWTDLENSGVFYAHDKPRNISNEIERESLPQGENVYISVEVYVDGTPETIAEAGFDTDGEALSIQNPDKPPADVSVAERPVPVTTELQAAVESGTLRVEVWA